MKKRTTASKKSSAATPAAGRSRRMKCACASCECTVDIDRGVRKGNLLYCGRACMTECTFEQCMCEHDFCAR